MTLQYIYKSTCTHLGIGPLLHTTTSPPSITSPRPHTQPSQPISLDLHFPCPFCNPVLQPAPLSGTGVLACISSTTNSFPDKWRVLRLCNFEDLTAVDWEADASGQYRHVAWIARPVGEAEVNSRGERRVEVMWKRRVGEDGMGTRFEGLLQRLREVAT